jgi:hypothetical protein
MRLLLLGIILWLFALVAFSTTIVNTASQPVNMRVVGAMAAATPTGTPSGGATPSPTPTATSTPADTPVTLWGDSSGLQNDATQSGSSCPILKTNVVNGKPVVRFTSAGTSFLNLATSITGAQPTTVFAVMRAASTSVDCFSLGDTATAIRGPFMEHTTASFAYITQTNAYNMAVPGGIAGFHVLRYVSDTQTAIDGTTGGAYWFGIPNTGNLTNIGKTQTTYGDGDIAEIIVYLGQPTVVEKANIEAYLGQKYGITVAGGGIPIDPTTVVNIRGWWKADQLASAPMSPLKIPGLKGWWKADAINTSGLREAWAVRERADLRPTGLPPKPKAGPEPRIVDGAPVAGWQDLSGFGGNFASTYGSPPTYVAAGVNGKPIVRFTGEALHVLDVTSFTMNQPFTAVVVAKKPNVATGGFLLDQANGDGVHSLALQVQATNGFLSISGNGSVVAQLIDTVNHQGAYHIFISYSNVASSFLFVDGTQTATGGITGNGLSSLRMQCNAAGNGLSEIDMAEAMIYDHVLTTTERQNLEASLKAKYGLP